MSKPRQCRGFFFGGPEHLQRLFLRAPFELEPITSDDIKDNPLDVPLQPRHLDAEPVSDSRHRLISLAALAECCGDGAEAISSDGGAGIRACGAITTPHGGAEGALQALTLSASTSSLMIDQGQQISVLTFHLLKFNPRGVLTLRHTLGGGGQHLVGLTLQPAAFSHNGLLCNRVHTPLMPAHQRPGRCGQNGRRRQQYRGAAHASDSDSRALASTGSCPMTGMRCPCGHR